MQEMKKGLSKLEATAEVRAAGLGAGAGARGAGMSIRKREFSDAKMAANGTAMKHIKDEAAKRRRHNNEQKRSAGLETLADNKATMMNAEVVITCKLLESCLGEGRRWWRCSK
jgi:hypothetical protein